MLRDRVLLGGKSEGGYVSGIIYNSGSTATGCNILDGGGASSNILQNINLMTIDGTKVTPDDYMSFTPGEHTFYIEFKKPLTDASWLFSHTYNTTYLDLSNLNTIELKSISYMFAQCWAEKLIINNWILTEIVDQFLFHNIPHYYNCDYNCSKLEMKNWKIDNSVSLSDFGIHRIGTLDLSDWDTSNVTSMYRMFDGCSGLTSLDLTNWDTSNVTSMYSMFDGCKSLTELRMGGNVSNVISVRYMFDGNTKRGSFYYNSGYDYNLIIEQLPSKWTAIPCTLVDGVLVPN